MVRQSIEQLGLEVELRDIQQSPEFRAELVSARNKQTVPVLRIEKDGEVQWMPESRDILAYLQSLSA